MLRLICRCHLLPLLIIMKGGNSMLRSIRDWWLGRGVARQVKRMDKRLGRLDEEFIRAFRSMDTQQAQLEMLIESQKRLLKRSEEALDTARAEVRVAEKTIETLVAANKLHTDRYDAESAIQTRRRVAVSGDPREDL